MLSDNETYRPAQGLNPSYGLFQRIGIQLGYQFSIVNIQ
jgi:hypothetical protein